MTDYNVKVRRILKGIYYVEYPNRKSMAEALIRFSESYDSEPFKGRSFSFEEVTQWYIANSKKGKETGQFTYHEDWEGFNFPSSVLEPFYAGKFESLSNAEKEILEIFRDTFESGEEFYIIAASSDIASRSVFQHELAHALFYLNLEYREKVLFTLANMTYNSFNLAREHVKNIHGVGYAAERMIDEIHAYLVEYDEFIEAGLDCPELRDTHRRLALILGKFCFMEKVEQFSPEFY